MINEGDELNRGDVEILDEEAVYRGFFRMSRFTLRHRLFRGGWSRVCTRELFRRRDAVGVLLYDPQHDRIALVEQFRVGVYARAGENPWLLEIVAGVIDKDGEAPADVAIREAYEESGCEITALEPVAEYFSSPGGTDEYFFIYCGRCDLSNAGGVFGLPEENEDIRVHVLAVDEAFARLQRREIRNGLTLVALQWLQLNRQRLRSQWR
jgi:ADP-ribose pyrophosphatase